MLLYYLTGIILLPGILLAIYAQIKVSVSYSKNAQIDTISNINGHDFALKILNAKDIYDVNIIKGGRDMSDYYNPRTKELVLSENSYYGTNISSLGVAAHEVGHAIQHAEGYSMLKLRNLIIPIANFGNSFLSLVILMSIFSLIFAPYSSFTTLMFWIGVGIFSLIALCALITLPVELDASKRAKKILSATNTLTDEEMEGAKEMLSSAALTYVAALVLSILNLVRFLALFANRRD